MIGKPGVKWNKKLRFGNYKKRLRRFAQTGQAAAVTLKERILGPNVDANGKRLPALARKGAYWTIDGRSGKRVRNQTSVAANRADFDETSDETWITIGGKRHKVKLYKGGYGALKKSRGGKDRRDGYFTGSMWKSLTVGILPPRRGTTGLRIKVYFAGSDKRVKVDAVYKGNPVKRSLRQRVKAERLMFTERNEDGSPTGRQAFLLVQWSPKEMGAIADSIAYDMAELIGT